MPDEPSSLIDRYNGAMLGCFVAAAADPLASGRYQFLRTRIQEYLRSESLALELPVEHEAFVTNHEMVGKLVWSHAKGLSCERGDFCLIGSMAYFSLSERNSDPTSARELQSRCEALLRK